MCNLKPEEIRLLSKLNNRYADYDFPCAYFKYDYQMDMKQEIDMFLNNGLLRLSDYRYELGKLTVPQLKQIALDYSLSGKGKKATIVDDILANVSQENLDKLRLDKYFVLTADGERIISENSALLLWYDGLRHEIVKPEDIIKAQYKRESKDDYELLLSVYNDCLKKCGTNRERFPLLIDIKRIYQWQHNEDMEEKISVELSKINKILDDEQKAEYENSEVNKILGLSSEERQQLREEALAKLDDEWEKKIDAKYRAKAGL